MYCVILYTFYDKHLRQVCKNIESNIVYKVDAPKTFEDFKCNLERIKKKNSFWASLIFIALLLTRISNFDILQSMEGQVLGIRDLNSY